jgi:ribonucleoside-diphosphate reductase alpha subunit
MTEIFTNLEINETEYSFDLLTKLSRNLTTKDIKEIHNNILEYGIEIAANNLGNDISHYDNCLLSGRLLIFNLKMNSPKSLKEYLNMLGNKFDITILKFMNDNVSFLQSLIDKYDYFDYDNDNFSASTYINTYSLSSEFDGPKIEPPSYIYMRVCCQLFFNSFDPNLFELIYSNYLVGYITPASPTLFNSCLKKHQLASCFLLTATDDLKSIRNGISSIFDISKNSGGIGFDVSEVRGSGCPINGKGVSKGIINMLQVADKTIHYVDQGGVRKGALTIFLRSHHYDLLELIESIRNSGDPSGKLHFLQICIWTCNLFWDRCSKDEDWTLFCPHESAELNNKYGLEFDDIYRRLEKDPNIKHKKVMKAKKILDLIILVQQEKGGPYLMNGDACNYKSNQKNLGYIKSSNLCLEIVEYSDDKNIASCNLHSLNLRLYGKNLESKSDNVADAVDFDLLGSKVRDCVTCVNRMIDTNYYPFDDEQHTKGKISNLNFDNRPIAIGASGFSDLLYLIDMSFEHKKIYELNKMIFGCIYFNALACSVDLAIKDSPYKNFSTSPTAEGKLQFDLWKDEFELINGKYNITKRDVNDDLPLNPTLWNQKEFTLSNGDVISPSWEDLKRCVMKYGLRNSLLTGMMPTATTAQIRRNTESLEAPQSNVYNRTVLAGSYQIVNRHMVKDLSDLGLWNKTTFEFIQLNDGSLIKDDIYVFMNFVNENPNLYPNFNKNNLRLKRISDKYKTQWEIKQSIFINLYAQRARYIDQSQSFNIYFKNPTNDVMVKCHSLTWQLGVKTQIYYLRQRGGEVSKMGNSIGMKTLYDAALNDKICYSCS